MIEWLIVGLGNPGEKYHQSRHNAGFMVVDELALQMNAIWKLSSRFRAEIAEIGGYGFIKPQTYMNLSGDCVSEIARFYKIPAERILVAHDDLDIALGTVKVGLSKGPKQHNGLLSIERLLGTKDFWRVRVGVEDRTSEERLVIPGQAYVLMPLSESEQTVMKKGIKQAVNQIARVIGCPECVKAVEANS